jgi:hypothetical protein
MNVMAVVKLPAVNVTVLVLIVKEIVVMNVMVVVM